MSNRLLITLLAMTSAVACIGAFLVFKDLLSAIVLGLFTLLALLILRPALLGEAAQRARVTIFSVGSFLGLASIFVCQAQSIDPGSLPDDIASLTDAASLAPLLQILSKLVEILLAPTLPDWFAWPMAGLCVLIAAYLAACGILAGSQLPAPTEADSPELAADIALYHSDLLTELYDLNHEIQPIDQSVAELESDDLDGGPGARVIPRGNFIKRLRSQIRVLTELTEGGDKATAQLSSLQRPSVIVRNAVRLLLRSDEPLILLGDPGSGKSMTIRAVGMELIKRERRRRLPRIVVYARLGTYRDDPETGQPPKVEEFVRRQISDDRPHLQEHFSRLLADGRVVVLFDGMDEMPRHNYSRKVLQLSGFAKGYSATKTLYACRINDFSTEFVHQRMFLMPFDKRRIREFVRRFFSKGHEIDGKRLSHRRIAREIMDRADAGMNASNPMMLALMCGFLAREHVWPRSRDELFSSYLDNLIDEANVKLAMENKPGLDEGGRERMMFDWSRLAFAISISDSGTVGRLSVAEHLFADQAVAILRWGRRAGLLLEEPGEPDAFRFTHHRLQEFLTARHLAALEDQGRSLSDRQWKRLLDSPRWQETLVMLTSQRPGTAGLKVLTESLEDWSGSAEHYVRAIDNWPEAGEEGDEAVETEVPDGWPVPSDMPLLRDSIGKVFFPMGYEDEVAIADRTSLAAEILAEAGAVDAAELRRLRAVFDRAVICLGRVGRPPAQVKATWAWGRAPGPRTRMALANQLESIRPWVRRQALNVLADLLRSDRLGRGDPTVMDRGALEEKLIADSAGGRLIERAFDYKRLLSTGSARQLTLFAGLLSFEVLQVVLLLGAVWYFGIYLDGIRDLFELPSLVWLGIILASAVAVVASGVTRGVGSAEYIMWAAVAVVSLAALQRLVHGLVTDDLWPAILAALDTFRVVLPGSLSQLAVMAAALAFGSWLSRVDGRKAASARLYLDSDRVGFLLTAAGLSALLCFVSYTFFHFTESMVILFGDTDGPAYAERVKDWGGTAISILFPLLGVLWFIGLFVGAWSDSSGGILIRAIKSVGVLIAFVLFSALVWGGMIFAFKGMEWLVMALFDTSLAQAGYQVAYWAVVVVLVLLLVALSIILMRVSLLNLLDWVRAFRSRPMVIEDWLAEFATARPFKQLMMLRATTAGNLQRDMDSKPGLSLTEFKHFLLGLAESGAVQPGTRVDEQLWRKQMAIDQAIRQQGVGAGDLDDLTDVEKATSAASDS